MKTTISQGAVAVGYLYWQEVALAHYVLYFSKIVQFYKCFTVLLLLFFGGSQYTGSSLILNQVIVPGGSGLWALTRGSAGGFKQEYFFATSGNAARFCTWDLLRVNQASQHWATVWLPSTSLATLIQIIGMRWFMTVKLSQSRSFGDPTAYSIGQQFIYPLLSLNSGHHPWLVSQYSPPEKPVTDQDIKGEQN